MAVVFQGIEGKKKDRMVIGYASVLRLGHGNTKTLLSFFPNNIGAKHFLRAKTLNSSNLTHQLIQYSYIKNPIFKAIYSFITYCYIFNF